MDPSARRPVQAEAPARGSSRRPTLRALLSALASVLLSACCVAPPPTLQISVSSPQPRAVVGQRVLVKGRVSDPSIDLWVLVHPLGSDRWWVQPRPSPANRDGSWRSVAYLGTPDLGVGDSFEIVAVATCSRLHVGDAIRWDRLHPKSRRSDILAVTRVDSQAADPIESPPEDP